MGAAMYDDEDYMTPEEALDGVASSISLAIRRGCTARDTSWVVGEALADAP